MVMHTEHVFLTVLTSIQQSNKPTIIICHQFIHNSCNILTGRPTFDYVILVVPSLWSWSTWTSWLLSRPQDSYSPSFPWYFSERCVSVNINSQSQGLHPVQGPISHRSSYASTPGCTATKENIQVRITRLITTYTYIGLHHENFIMKSHFSNHMYNR